MPPRAGSPLEVELENVCLDRGRRILHGIDWRINAGQRWVLLGANGSGKTQLLKIVAGQVWPTPDGRHGLRWRRAGRWHSTPQFMLEHIAYLGPERQDKHERYGWNHSVLDVVGTGIHHSDIPLEPLSVLQRRRAQKNLRNLHALGLAARPFLTLSYGERRRVLLARAFASNPGLLLLDEVLTGLDESQRRAVLHALEAPDRARRSWVLSVHRQQDLPRNATHLLVLAQGRAHYCGPWRQSVLQEYFAQAKADASIHERPRRSGGSRPTRARSKAPLFKFTGASVYLDYRLVLRNIDWEVRAAECWIVRGPNGAGKSTLLRTIYGDHTVAVGGMLSRAGISPGVPLSEFKRRCALVAPHLQTDYPRATQVLDVVVSGLHSSIGLNEKPNIRERATARRALELCGAEPLATRRLSQLSYGQVRRVLFARALVARPQLLLLDEAFAGLDGTTRQDMLTMVDALIARGVAVVLATHLQEELPSHAEFELRLCAGRAEITRLLPHA